jgi:hypothetical protein
MMDHDDDGDDAGDDDNTLGLPVAVPCAAMAPVATDMGFCAAPRAMVERKDRSPNSAANTSEKICSSVPLETTIKGYHDRNRAGEGAARGGGSLQCDDPDDDNEDVETTTR